MSDYLNFTIIGTYTNDEGGVKKQWWAEVRFSGSIFNIADDMSDKEKCYFIREQIEACYDEFQNASSGSYKPVNCRVNKADSSWNTLLLGITFEEGIDEDYFRNYIDAFMSYVVENATLK